MSDQIYNVGGQIVTPDIYFQIAMGMIPGMAAFNGSGYNPTLRADWETVWFTGGMYSWPSAADVISVVSDDADDNVAGSGAQQVQITGLASNWTLVTEIVDLNGATPVNLITPLIRVNRAQVIRAGASLANEGNITVSHAVTGTLQTIESQYNSSRAAVFSVPVGFTAALTGVTMSMFGNAGHAQVALLRTKLGEPYEIMMENIIPNGFPVSIESRMPQSLAPQTDFQVITVTDTSNRDSEVSVNFIGFYIQEGYQ